MSAKSGNAWSNMLLDQEMATQLEGLTKPVDNRGVEAYRSNENAQVMKAENAKQRKKNRIRPYQIEKNKPKAKSKKGQKNKQVDENRNKQNVNKQNDIPEMALGLKRQLKIKKEITEFHTLEEVSEEIRYRLWERKRHMIRDIVETVGKPICIEVVQQVAKIEIEGGMPRHNKGRKTPGGVFIQLLKKRDDVDQTELTKIMKNHDPAWMKASRAKQLRLVKTALSEDASEAKNDAEKPAEVKNSPKSDSAPMFFSPEANLF